MRHLRVLMLTTDLQRGGLPLRLVTLAQYLRRLNVEPIVGCLSRTGPLSDVLESAGVEMFSCDAGGSFDARCLIRFAAIVRRIDPDLIHSSLFHANLAARLVGRLDRHRPIMTSTVTIEIERAWHRWLEFLTGCLSDCHIANSEAVARHVRDELGFSPERVFVIPNGLDIDAIDRVPPIRRQDYGIEEDTPLIIWGGRMDPVKNLDTFVEVVAQVRRERKVSAVLLGDGPDRSRIKSLVEKQGLTRDIYFLGWSENVVGWMKSADLLLFPSWTEGCPNVVLEAMACRCPVIAGDVPACSELLLSGKHGILCQSGDVSHFSRATRSMLVSSDGRSRRVDAAREWVLRQHSVQDVVCRWRDTYDRLMRESSHSAITPLHH